MKSVRSAPSDKKSMITDADILWYGTDRMERTKAGGGYEKVESYKKLEPALTDFLALRKTILD